MNSHLISAAAGTGKTYQLALRFIALLVCGVAPERLIAITFTRKAAGEFKDRILTLLASLAQEADSPEQARKRETDIALIRQLINGKEHPRGLFPGMELPEGMFDASRFADLLKKVAVSLSRMSLGTNDSLFFKLNATLSYELGVTGVSVMDDREKRRACLTALRSLGRSCMQEQESSEVLQDMLDTATHANASNPEESQMRQIEELHQLFLSSPREAWGNAAAFGLEERVVAPRRSREEYETALQELIDEAGDPAYCHFLRSFERVPETGKMTLLNSKGNPDGKSTIASKLEALEKKKLIPDSHRERLEELIDDAIAWCWSLSIRDTLVARRMLEEYDGHYHSLVRSRGKYLFDDITRQLAGAHFSKDLQRTLRYRLFCRWDHWLLDEFQDTSHDQWNVLEPFLEDVYDSNDEGSVFFVGDPKQSIYGWRGGDPAIFREVPSRFPSIITRDLTESFRSAQGVLDLVNTVFEGTGRGRSIDYLRHTCAAPLEGKKGCAQIWQTGEGAESKKDAVYEAVFGIIQQVWRKDLSLAILVRSNAEGRELGAWLKSRGIPAEVNDDVMIGQDSPVMKHILQFFTWLLHPGDALNEALLMASPLWKALKRQNDPDPFSWAGWKKYIEKNGYTVFFDKVLAALPDELPPFQKNRLQAVMAYAAEADEKGMLLQEWVDYLRDLRRRDNPSSRVVQIMTIHKSKGLGFDVVILPQVSPASSFADARRMKYLVREDASSRPAAIVKYPGKIAASHTEALVPYLEEWRLSQRVEGYCQLYVALTRAKSATYVVLQYSSSDEEKDPDKEGMFSILREAASDGTDRGGPVLEGGDCRYSSGEPDWYEHLESRPAVTEETSESQLQPMPAPRRLVRQSPSHLESPGAGDTYPALSLEMQGGADFGTEVHAVFERIIVWDEGLVPEWALHPSNPAERIVAECLAVPEIRALFTVPAGKTVLNEQRIEDWSAREQEDIWTSGSIDRLILGEGEAHIIDFKTDRVEQAGELIDRHRSQLERYREIVSRATGIPAGAIRCSIVSTCLKTVIDL